MTPTTSTAAASEVTIREVAPADAEACARICFEAFGAIHDHHRFPRDFPVLEAAAGIMGIWIPHPSIWGVVAELDGTIVGKFGKAGKGLGEFSTVHAIDCRNPNELYVVEISAWRAQKILLNSQQPPQSVAR